jgi:hypothetical protein
MEKKTSPASKWLKQRDPVPEISLPNLIKLMSEGFGILSSVKPRGQNYAVRFTDKPNTLRASSNEEFRSMLVITHHRNGEFVSPLCIKQILVKFEIDEDEFRKVYNRVLSQQATGTENEAP